MSAVLVDSNVIVDVTQDDPRWAPAVGCRVPGRSMLSRVSPTWRSPTFAPAGLLHRRPRRCPGLSSADPRSRPLPQLFSNRRADLALSAASIQQLLHWLDLAGVAVFAVSGALEAARKQLDPVGFLFVAAVTGIGGGTLRDVLLDRPVFWLHDPAYLWITSAAALATFFVAPHVQRRAVALLWADAMGMAVFCVLGRARRWRPAPGRRSPCSWAP